MAWKTRTGVWLNEPPAFDGAEAAIIRGQCGLSQEEFGLELGVSRWTVQQWERMGRTFHFQNKLHREKLAALMDAAREAQL